MIVSETPNRVTSRWLQASVLLCAMAVLPFGMVYAQDYDAVEKRLGKAVGEGELTLEQAAVMMNALREESEDCDDREESCEHDADMEEWFEGIGRIGEQLKAAVKAGKLTEEQAWQKWIYIKEKQIAPKLKAMVKAGKMTEEEGLSVWRSIEKAEAGERIKAAVAKGQITEEEARAKLAEINKEGDRKAGIEGHFNKFGVTDETLTRVRNHLQENGVTDKQIEPVLGGMLRVIHAVLSKGEDFELDPRLRGYFEKEVGLTDKQVELVERVSRRVAHGLKDSNLRRGEGKKDIDYKAIGMRIRAAVKAGKLTEEQAKAKWAEIKKAAAQDKDVD